MATYRHMVECRNCGALYRFDDPKETPRGFTNTVYCRNYKRKAPHTVIATARMMNIPVKDLPIRAESRVGRDGADSVG